MERYGLCNDTIMVDVKDADVQLADIILKDKALPPYQLKVDVSDKEPS